MTMPMTFGDLARTLSMRSSTTNIKSNMATLSEELVTGRASDLTKKVRGDFSVIAGLERSLGLQKGWNTASREASGMAAAQQVALGRISPRLADMGLKLAANADSVNHIEFQTVMDSAEEEFSLLLDALNSSYAGRTVFSGTATHGPSLADAETILADLALAVGSETTAVDVMAAADAWFNDPAGGFETVAYTGSLDTLSPFAVGENERITIGTTAADPELRQAIKQVALTALIARGIPTLAPDEQTALNGLIGGEMLNTNTEITHLQAKIGAVEARIQEALVRGETNATALQITRETVIGVDAFETASKLQESEVQLQAIYTVTARMSQLSLASVLR